MKLSIGLIRQHFRECGVTMTEREAGPRQWRYETLSLTICIVPDDDAWAMIRISFHIKGTDRYSADVVTGNIDLIDAIARDVAKLEDSIADLGLWPQSVKRSGHSLDRDSWLRRAPGGISLSGLAIANGESEAPDDVSSAFSSEIFLGHKVQQDDSSGIVQTVRQVYIIRALVEDADPRLIEGNFYDLCAGVVDRENTMLAAGGMECRYKRDGGQVIGVEFVGERTEGATLQFIKRLSDND